MKSLYLALVLTIISFSVAAELRIEAYKAPFHVGEKVMACGTVKQVSSKKTAHFLNLDKPYPNQTLTLLIWNSDISGFEKRFGNLDNFKNQKVCARGKITEYNNSLQIILSNPQFLRLMK
ncbi:hypothetical protein AAFX30_08250 [Vibrio chagasii]|uniref:hypothetical protein n=1 Tax=Vibrio chagasii TaxID=170679 RepID=UPI0038CD4EFB